LTQGMDPMDHSNATDPGGLYAQVEDGADHFV
jgi:hypothetical protein